MKLTKLELNDQYTSACGLAPVSMNRLGQTVVIAGKNGSGKSRLLELLEKAIGLYPTLTEQSAFPQMITNHQTVITSWTDKVSTLRSKLIAPDAKNESKAMVEAEINRNLESIKSYETSIAEWKRRIALTESMHIDPQKANNSIIRFVPKSTILRDSYGLSSQQLDEYANSIYTLGNVDISVGALAAIEKIQRQWFNASHPDTQSLIVSQDQVEIIKDNYEKLKRYIKTFLNTDLKRTMDGHPVLFGKRIGEAKLSEGQIILLQFCMALYAQETNLNDLIIIMDEPENHLHPGALIEVLDKISRHVTNGQLWIATHSVSVLAHFDPSCIWFMENGSLSYAGNVPGKVLESLLGADDEIQKLASFLSLPAEMAANRFAFESLVSPGVVLTGPDDPQMRQIQESIQHLVKTKNRVSVLDFGMGKGRLLSTIYENKMSRGGEITQWLDYTGYDIDATHKVDCERLIETIYGASNQRYFNAIENLLANKDDESLDLIVMCNVFHEIDPKDWITLFMSMTSPIKLLKTDGYLLIVEDQFLAVGEKAHANGFLVFDTLEFKKLFGIRAADTYTFTDQRGDGRLKAHRIPKACLGRITPDSRREAVALLEQNARNKIKELRRQPPSYKNGRLHGFWAQQLANASLTSEEL